MSNLIKYTFVNFDKEDSYVIDYEKKEKPVEEPELQMTQCRFGRILRRSC
ncbi:MAG: hypothetical protein ACLSCU_02110 [Eubacterium sp.]